MRVGRRRALLRWLALPLLLVLSVAAAGGGRRSAPDAAASPVPHSQRTNQTVAVAVLAPDRGFTFAWYRLQPAFALAEEEVNSRYKPLRLNLKYRNDNCSEYLAPNLAMELYMEHKTAAFFGPVCNYAFAPVARFASYRRLPLFTAGALVDAFDDQREPGDMYSSITRMLGSYSHLAGFFLQLFRSFGWLPRNESNLEFYVQENSDRAKGRTEEYFICSGIYNLFTSRSVGYSRNAPRHQFSVGEGWTDRLSSMLRQSKNSTRSTAQR